MRTCEAEEAFSGSTPRTQAEDLSLEISVFGTGMVLDNHLEGSDAALIAFERGEEMVVMRESFCGYAPLRKGLEVGESMLMAHRCIKATWLCRGLSRSEREERLSDRTLRPSPFAPLAPVHLLNDFLIRQRPGDAVGV